GRRCCGCCSGRRSSRHATRKRGGGTESRRFQKIASWYVVARHKCLPLAPVAHLSRFAAAFRLPELAITSNTPSVLAPLGPEGASVLVTGKIKTLAEVVKTVPDGTHVALGGFAIARNPVAVVHELIRQNKRNLTVSQGV